MSDAAVRASGVAVPRALPSLPRGGADTLTSTQRRLMIAAIVAAHGVGAWGLLQVGAVRVVVLEVAPMFVDLIAPSPPAPPVPPVAPPLKPQPIVKKLRSAVPVIAAAPSPAPSSFVVPAPLAEPVVVAPVPPEPVVVAAPAPPAPSAEPRVIPASAVQYLEPPAPEYPRLSRRIGESGRVLVLVFIDEAGRPHRVQVARSSGYMRLDDAALAAVQRARFRPPTFDGQPISGWANVPIDFGLEK